MASLISATSTSVINVLGTVNTTVSALSDGVEYAASYIADARRKQQLDQRYDALVFEEQLKLDKAKQIATHGEQIQSWIGANQDRATRFNAALASLNSISTVNPS
ncbi:hypothetical protein [Mesorhizobium sp. CN2-181]|uniref:hypothetical protein n=1 Tax=Mesorhizobium yinganensis TaxID=3157707 RepID=UPI0032B7C303